MLMSTFECQWPIPKSNYLSFSVRAFFFLCVNVVSVHNFHYLLVFFTFFFAWLCTSVVNAVGDFAREVLMVVVRRWKYCGGKCVWCDDFDLRFCSYMMITPSIKALHMWLGCGTYIWCVNVWARNDVKKKFTCSLFIQSSWKWRRQRHIDTRD